MNFEILNNLIEVAMGEKKADLVLRNGSLVNVYTGEIQEEYSVAVKGERIAWVYHPGIYRRSHPFNPFLSGGSVSQICNAGRHYHDNYGTDGNRLSAWISGHSGIPGIT